MEEMVYLGYQFGTFKDDKTGRMVHFASMFTMEPFPASENPDYHTYGYKGDKHKLASPSVLRGLDLQPLDVVEVYFDPPYVNGGIEKASANLVRYAKTGLLVTNNIGMFYDLNSGEAWYVSPMPETPTAPLFIQLVPGNGDTMESWFKMGGVDAIADKLLADGKIKPCILTTSRLEFMNRGPQPPSFKVHTLRAADYPTWAQRRRALVHLLMSLSKE